MEDGRVRSPVDACVRDRVRVGQAPNDKERIDNEANAQPYSSRVAGMIL